MLYRQRQRELCRLLVSFRSARVDLIYLIKLPSDHMYIWSYRPQVIECLFITDVACTYDLTNLARNLRVSLVVVIESASTALSLV